MVPDDIPLPFEQLGEVRMANIPRQVSRALAAVSRDDALWKPLGHPSWAGHHVLRLAGPGTTRHDPHAPTVGGTQEHTHTHDKQRRRVEGRVHEVAARCRLAV